MEHDNLHFEESGSIAIEGLKRQKNQRKTKSCNRRVLNFLFSHVGLATFVILYSIMGGALFRALEGPEEVKVKDRIKWLRDDTVGEIMQLAIHLNIQNLNQHQFAEQIKGVLSEFQTHVVSAVKASGFNGNLESDESSIQWSFAGSLLYAVTVITTIGYGHVVPKTTAGRLVTILYALVGIPLTFLFLSNMGNFAAKCFRLFYKKVCCGLCIYVRLTRHKSFMASVRERAEAQIKNQKAFDNVVESAFKSQKSASMIARRATTSDIYHQTLSPPGSKKAQVTPTPSNTDSQETTTTTTLSHIPKLKVHDTRKVKKRTTDEIDPNVKNHVEKFSDSNPDESKMVSAYGKNLSPVDFNLTTNSEDKENFQNKSNHQLLNQREKTRHKLSDDECPLYVDQQESRSTSGKYMDNITDPLRRSTRRFKNSILRRKDNATYKSDSNIEVNVPCPASASSSSFCDQSVEVSDESFVEIERILRSTPSDQTLLSTPRSGIRFPLSRSRDRTRVQRILFYKSELEQTICSSELGDSKSEPLKRAAKGNPDNSRLRKDSLIFAPSLTTIRIAASATATAAAIAAMRQRQVTSKSSSDATNPTTNITSTTSSDLASKDTTFTKVDVTLENSSGSLFCKEKTTPLANMITRYKKFHSPLIRRKIPSIKWKDQRSTHAKDAKTTSISTNLEPNQLLPSKSLDDLYGIGRSSLRFSSRWRQQENASTSIPDESYKSLIKSRASSSNQYLIPPHNSPSLQPNFDHVSKAKLTEESTSKLKKFSRKTIELPETGEDVDSVNMTVPISICLIIIALYIYLGALLFSYWEEWDMLTGAYFCFITLSTIGFGDIVPGTDLRQSGAHQKLLLCSIWLVVGLSLLAMCFNLMQEEVRAKLRWLGTKVGIIKD